MTMIDDRPVATGPRPGGRAHWRWVAAGVVVLAVLLAAVLAVVVRDDGQGDVATGGATSSTTPAPTASTTTPTTATTVPPTVPPTLPPSATDLSTAIWPFAGSGPRFDDAVEAARAFAATFLRFSAPVAGELREGDSRSGEVDVRPAADGPVTTVMVRRMGDPGSWFVIGAVTAGIDVTSPPAGEQVSSPVTVRGRALAFEGTVRVEVREDGELGAIGEGVVTGGGDVARPFEGAVPFETPGAPFGAIVAFTESAEDGGVWEAAALRVRFHSTDADAATCGGYLSPRLEPGPGQMEVKAYFNCDVRDDVAPFPVYRLVPASAAVLRASLEALLAGPTAAEQDAGVTSWFSGATAGMLRSVTIVDGHAVVDFGDLPSVVPNASTSAGSALLLSQLDATVLQFPSVASVEYRLLGDCQAFSSWLQRAGCERRTRPASED